MKTNHLWIAALAMAFVACNNEPFFEGVQENKLNHSPELKNGGTEGEAGSDNFLGFGY